jgi:hypothetical protein
MGGLQFPSDNTNNGDPNAPDSQFHVGLNLSNSFMNNVLFKPPPPQPPAPPGKTQPPRKTDRSTDPMDGVEKRTGDNQNQGEEGKEKEKEKEKEREKDTEVTGSAKGKEPEGAAGNMTDID